MQEALSALFDRMYLEKKWGDGIRSPLSGPGSTAINSVAVLEWIKELAPASLVDIGCGDMTWMSKAMADHPTNYVGIDVSMEALRLAQRRIGKGAVFVSGDVTSRTFSVSAEMIVIKDVLFHFTDDLVLNALQQLSQCSYRWLILNTDPDAVVGKAREMDYAHWCAVDLERQPFVSALSRCGGIVARKPRPGRGEFLLIRGHA